MKKSPVLPWLAHAMRFAGCCLICGSAVAFIAMNQGARLQDAQFFYWQRYFVDGVVSVATLPGIWLFFAGSLLWWLCQRTKKTLLLAVMALLVVINSQCGSNTSIGLALAISSGVGQAFAGILVLAVGLAEMVDAIL